MMLAFDEPNKWQALDVSTNGSLHRMFESKPAGFCLMRMASIRFASLHCVKSEGARRKALVVIGPGVLLGQTHVVVVGACRDLVVQPWNPEHVRRLRLGHVIEDAALELEHRRNLAIAPRAKRGAAKARLVNRRWRCAAF